MLRSRVSHSADPPAGGGTVEGGAIEPGLALGGRPRPPGWVLLTKGPAESRMLLIVIPAGPWWTVLGGGAEAGGGGAPEACPACAGPESDLSITLIISSLTVMVSLGPLET